MSRKELETGKSLQEIKLPQAYFGEGIVLLKNKIYLLTWQNETVLIYDAGSFKEISKNEISGRRLGIDNRRQASADEQRVIVHHFS